VDTENVAAREGSCSEADLSANGSGESSLKNVAKTKSATRTSRRASNGTTSKHDDSKRRSSSRTKQNPRNSSPPSTSATSSKEDDNKRRRRSRTNKEKASNGSQPLTSMKNKTCEDTARGVCDWCKAVAKVKHQFTLFTDLKPEADGDSPAHWVLKCAKCNTQVTAEMQSTAAAGQLIYYILKKNILINL